MVKARIYKKLPLGTGYVVRVEEDGVTQAWGVFDNEESGSDAQAYKDAEEFARRNVPAEAGKFELVHT